MLIQHKVAAGDARRLHRRRPARADARLSPGSRSGSSSGSSIPRRMRPPARWASSSSAPYDDPDALEQLAAGAAVVTYEFENVPVEAARAVVAVAAAAGARAGAGPPGREAALPAPRHPDGPLRLARRLGAAGARQVAAARLRREGAAPGGARRGARRARAGRGDRALRPRAVDHRRPRAATARRASGRSPRTCIATASCASRGHPPSPRRRRRPRSSSAGCSRSSTTSACSRSSCSRSDGRLLANEFAPRVHNTGHWTIDGAVTSQFENHLRAILGLPLGSTDALAPAVMLNLIGGAPASEKLLELPGRAPSPLRQGAAARPQDRPRHAGRRVRGDGRRGDRARRRVGRRLGPA